MAFIARLDGGRLIGALVCDAAACGREIALPHGLDASIVAVPPSGDAPSPLCHRVLKSGTHGGPCPGWRRRR
jgi:hypothetical protein